jgi:hypothetical protein
VAVKSFMAKELQGELVELLEKIVLHNSAFSNNANLQVRAALRRGRQLPAGQLARPPAACS